MANTGESGGLGAWCETKRLYNHSSETSGSGSKWSEFADMAMEERRLKLLGESFAVVHRLHRKKLKDQDGTLGPWETLSIEVQSPRLRKILTALLHDYPGWNTKGTPFTFFPPFPPFFHKWERLSSPLSEFGDPGDAAGEMEMALLRDELTPSLDPLIATLNNIKETGAVSFDNLWMIFAPGTLVAGREDGQLSVGRLLRIEFVEESESLLGRDPPKWRLKLARIDWNGSYCGYTVGFVEVAEFKDLKHIQDMATFPLHFMRDHEKVREALVMRGRRFASLRGSQTKTCRGRKFVKKEDSRGMEKVVAKPVRHNFSSLCFHFCLGTSLRKGGGCGVT